MKIYIVGGAVRDELLGKTPKDIDYVVTGATSEGMLALGYEQVGADFPVFLHPETKDEYALARIERKTGTGYHGFAVDYDPTVSLEEDLSRRDLTINAMAKDPDTGEIIDPHGGRHDLKAKVLRHVSPAFAEDPLRVIRLARFAARYFGFTIATSTMIMATEMVERGDLNHLPNERFWAEMEKALTEEDAGQFFWVLDDVHAFKHVPFFADLFGDGSPFLSTAALMAFTSIREHLGGRSPEERLMFFTALMAQAERKTIWSAPVRTQKLYTNIWKVRATEAATADSVFSVLQSAKLWSQGSDFTDLVRGMVILEKMEEKLFISARDLADIGIATRAVKAEQFPGMEGKALGEAIARTRKEVIANLIDAKTV